ncbi:MAG: hypothetical protein AB7L66_19045 [Gemmatimonadales bacterium]
MLNALHHEATFLRAALLLGVVREDAVHAWAEEELVHADLLTPLLIGVVEAPAALSPVREALRAFERPVDVSRSAGAMLAFLRLEPDAAARPAADRIRILGALRRELAPTPEVAAGIKVFEDRAMLAAGGVGSETVPANEELDDWLESARPEVWFRFGFGAADEAAAFLGAVSRKLVRDRPASRAAGERVPRVWQVPSPAGGRSVLVLDEGAWDVVRREFAPLPVASCIPHLSLPVGALPVLDGEQAEALGREAAGQLLLR